MKTLISLSLLSLCTALTVSSCSDDDVNIVPTVEVPESYLDFEGVNYDGQLSRLAQLRELKAYMSTAGANTSLDSARLSAMYRNEPGAMFSQNFEKQLADKTFASHREDYERYFGRIAANSTSTVPGNAGVAGFAEAQNGKTYLLDANGVEYLQAIEKGLMGATFYYQATSVYLGEDKLAASNERPSPTEASDREHHWDEAFGYFGAPQDFPTNTDGVVFWADYTNDRNEMLQVNKPLMDAFLKGRAAITANNDTELDAAIKGVRQQWERVAAGTAIHYLNAAIEHGNDVPRRMHDLTEAVAFAKSLVYNAGSTLTPAQVNGQLATFAGSADYADMNLYNVTDADVVALRTAIASAHGLNNASEL